MNILRWSSEYKNMKRPWLGFLQIIIVLVAILASLAQAAAPVPTKDKFRFLGVFLHNGKSHFDVFRPLLEELARRGHDVTVISFFPRKNEKLKGYKDVSLLENANDTAGNIFKPGDYQHYPIILELWLLGALGIDMCKRTLRNPEVQRLIRSDVRFDLIITEAFNTDCAFGFVHRFKAPFISISSYDIVPWINNRVNNPDNPSYIPGTLTHFAPKMSFYERLVNTVILVYQQIAYEILYNWPIQAELETAFGPGVPPLREMAKNTSAILANTHFTVHGARPYLPNVIEIGGIHIGDVKPLPEDIKSFLDDAHEGALLFSWGSLIKASSLSKDKLDEILKVLGSIPRRVIWKWEDENLPGKPNNVMTKKWLPQFDIMNHPNVKGYLGHGGNLGMTEAVYSGLPMVIVATFGDQFHNAAPNAARGAAVLLSFEKLNEKTLRDALNRIFNDTSYRENAQALSRAFRDRPASPLETAVWWSEYFARGNGSPFIRSSGADLAWYQYHLLDVCGFLIVVSLAALYVTYRLLRILIKPLFFGRSNTSRLHDKGKKKD